MTLNYKVWIRIK